MDQCQRDVLTRQSARVESSSANGGSASRLFFVFVRNGIISLVLCQILILGQILACVVMQCQPQFSAWPEHEASES